MCGGANERNTGDDMVARCHPPAPEFEHPTVEAVWAALRDQLPDDAVPLANLRFTGRKGDLEADLVVSIPGAGVAVLEVKGGAAPTTARPGGRRAAAR